MISFEVAAETACPTANALISGAHS
jgi:hypothetical protein